MLNIYIPYIYIPLCKYLHTHTAYLSVTTVVVVVSGAEAGGMENISRPMQLGKDVNAMKD